MKRLFLITTLLCIVQIAYSQNVSQKERLDFAKTYFEVGAKGFPSFSGKQLSGNVVAPLQHTESIQPYITWGGFHFWGHAEFYVEFPIEQLAIRNTNASDFRLNHFIVTGFRLMPLTYKEKTIRPYLGISWSGLEFSQTLASGTEQPIRSKEFEFVTDIGLLYGYRGFALRIGFTFFPDNTWKYPISKSKFTQIETPSFAAQLGLLYSFDSSRNEKPESIERWNSYPIFSSPGSNASKSSDFFIGAGPSNSFSLSRSTYNQKTFPFLQDQVSSFSYFDFSVGYQFNRLGLFAALSFRNPEYETEGYDVQQHIQKNSLAFEINKFLFDYSGFAPYVGLNVAYDHIQYAEEIGGSIKDATFEQIEPGITIGWDILPGKSEEYLILRTNLRWFPFSSFDISGTAFEFSQLEYNLIQVVFYPGRLLRAKK